MPTVFGTGRAAVIKALLRKQGGCRLPFQAAPAAQRQTGWLASSPRLAPGGFYSESGLNAIGGMTKANVRPYGMVDPSQSNEKGDLPIAD